VRLKRNRKTPSRHNIGSTSCNNQLPRSPTASEKRRGYLTPTTSRYKNNNMPIWQALWKKNRMHPHEDDGEQRGGRSLSISAYTGVSRTQSSALERSGSAKTVTRTHARTYAHTHARADARRQAHTTALPRSGSPQWSEGTSSTVALRVWQLDGLALRWEGCHRVASPAPANRCTGTARTWDAPSRVCTHGGTRRHKA